MRVGFEGEGDPIPLEALPGASDLGELPTQTLLLTEADGFKAEDYVNLGYTHYEVICIGAAGGRGGDERAGNLFSSGEYTVNSIGGGPGGGGLHVVSGLLVALPALVEVIIGQPGVKGGDDDGQPHYADDKVYAHRGTDGGYSSFNGDTCMASGGKGGLPPSNPYNTEDAPDPNPPGTSQFYRPGGKGGDGGVGGRTEAGGGAEGVESIFTRGTTTNYDTNSETNSANWTFPAGKDGSWDGTIGEGGGGGSGGKKIVYIQGGGQMPGV